MKKLLVLLFVFSGLISSASEFGSVVTVAGESPTPVLFLRCRSQALERGNEERPTVCGGRETKDTFRAKAARLTNLGETVVWVHVGEDRVPLLPRSVMTLGPLDRPFDRLFLSVTEGETARVHVFASTEVVLDRAWVYPEPENARR